MKSIKKILALLLSIMLVISLLAGCSGGDKTSGESPDSTETAKPSDNQETPTGDETPVVDENPYKDPIKISIAHWDIDQSITGAEDAVYDIIKEKFNIEIVPQPISWGDYKDKINVWSASGELPDVFSIDMIGTPTFSNWINNNLIAPLPDDLSKYPSLKQIVDQSDVQAYKFNNKMYFIPRATYKDANWWANDRGILVREDWMDSLGLKAPTSDQEFIDMMVAFTNDDPDGNGQNDTVGLTVLNSGFLWSSAMNIAPQLSWTGWIKEDGKFIRNELSKEAFDFYSFARKLYNAGGLDKDFAVLQGEDGINKFASGKAGALAIQVAPKHIAKVYNVWSKLFDDQKMTDSIGILPSRPDNNGDYWRFITTSFWSESYINAAVDENKMDRILALYDFLISDEGFTLMWNGIEGVDYKVNADGTFENLMGTKDDGTAITTVDKYPFCYSMSYLATFGDDSQYDNTAIPEDIRTMSKEHLEWQLENAKAPQYEWVLGGLNTPTKDKVVLDGNADMIQFILSDKSEEEAWQEIIAKYEAQGYNNLVDEVNAAAKELGIE